MLDSSDRALVLRARGGEPDAFGELVRRYQASVFNVCYRLLGERGAAEDLAQEAFIRAYERLATFDVDRAFGPWMRRVAANVCLNHLERAGQAGVAFDDERDRDAATEAASAVGSIDPSIAIEREQAADALRRAILALAPQYRAVIELRHFQNLSYAEIAAELRIPISDVKSHLFRARKLLAHRLQPHD